MNEKKKNRAHDPSNKFDKHADFEVNALDILYYSSTRTSRRRHFRKKRLFVIRSSHSIRVNDYTSHHTRETIRFSPVPVLYSVSFVCICSLYKTRGVETY